MNARIEDNLMSADNSFSVEGVSDHHYLNAYNAANSGQTNQYTQGIVRAESGHCATIH